MVNPLVLRWPTYTYTQLQLFVFQWRAWSLLWYTISRTCLHSIRLHINIKWSVVCVCVCVLFRSIYVFISLSKQTIYLSICYSNLSMHFRSISMNLLSVSRAYLQSLCHLSTLSVYIFMSVCVWVRKGRDCSQVVVPYLTGLQHVCREPYLQEKETVQVSTHAKFTHTHKKTG